MFGDAIRAVRPDLMQQPHPSTLSDMHIKVRGAEEKSTDLSLDCHVRPIL